MPVVSEGVWICVGATGKGWDWTVWTPGGGREAGWAYTYMGAQFAARLHRMRLLAREGVNS